LRAQLPLAGYSTKNKNKHKLFEIRYSTHFFVKKRNTVDKKCKYL